MKIYPFQAVYPNLNLVTSPDSFFGSMKQDYPEFFKSGFFNKSKQAAIYIYTIKTDLKTYKSIVAANDIGDIESNKILKHEDTLAVKEQSMMQLILQRNALIKPVLLAYDGNSAINQFVAKEIRSRKPMFQVKFEESGDVHTFYEIKKNEKVQMVQQLFKDNVKKCYIADGHHRVATTCRLSAGDRLEKGQLNSMLSVYFPFEELDILDYNRSIQIGDDIDDAQIITRLHKIVKIRELAEAKKPTEKYCVTMLLNKQWYLLKWKKKIIKKYSKEGVVLDADILNRYVLKEILDIEDIKTDSRVKYIEGTAGIEGVAKLCNGENRRIGFCLYPISHKELKYVADNGLNLPPKSTWFEPRIKNGMIVQEL